MSLGLIGSIVIAISLGTAHAAPAKRLSVEQVSEEARLDEAAETSTLEAISRLKGIGGTVDGERKAEVLLRLADLYVDMARYAQLRGMRRLGEDKDRCFDTPGCDPDTIRDNEDLRAARDWHERAIKLYRTLLASWPTYARADEASFYLGQSLREVDRHEDAATELTRLVRSYPTSRFAPDAFVLLGEHHFDAGSPAKAIAAYERAAAWPDYHKAAFANYKLAWCYYNVGEHETGVDKLVAVVRAEGPVVLEEEALKDLPAFVAELRTDDAVERVLARIDRPDLRGDFYERVAAVYVQQGRQDEAVVALRRLLAADPSHPSAPRFADGIVRALVAMDRKEDALAELARARDTYAAGGAWHRANATRKDALDAAPTLLEERLRAVAVAWHQEARKLRGAQATRVYGLAERAYATYLEDFPSARNTYDVRYGYAELLYATRKFDAAYDQYMAVVAMDPKGRHSQFCAESAVFAAEEMVRRSPRPPAAGKAPVPLGEWEENQLAALDQLTTLYPGPKTQSALYESGWLLYHANQFEEASARFNRVIAMDPRAREAEQAANLILDSFALTENWEALRDNARFYHQQADLGSAAFKQDVRTIYENASLKLVEVGFARDGDDARAGEAYLAFWREFPASKNADLALHNAGAHLHAAGRFAEAVDARHTLATRFPGSRFWADGVAALAFGYESLARFEEAAGWYEALAAKAPGHASAPDALYSAAVFRAALGDWEVAVRDYQQYVARWPDRPDVARVTLGIGQILEQHGRLAEAAALYQKFRARPDGTVDELMFARLHEARLADGPKALALYTDALAWYDAGGDRGQLAVEYAAEMRWRLAEPRYSAFIAMAIDGPGGRDMSRPAMQRLLSDQTAAKVRTIGELEATYTAVIDTGSATWGLAALARMGAAYENLAETIRASYVPPWLTPEQREIYVQELEDLAWMQTERATQAYALAVDRSRALDHFDHNTEWATRRLGELRPADYPSLFERLPEARFVAPAVYTGEPETR
ncbi:MAG: tetratricopeptide repeat protein [Myxococcota bacterium]